MKKVLVLMLALVMCCALAACGGNNNDNGNNSLGGTPTNALTPDVEVDVNDLIPGNTTINDTITAPTFSVGGNNSKIEEYIQKNRNELLSSMESSFATSSGMTCTSDVKVVGNGFIIYININELNNVSATQKAQMQAAYDQLGSQFDTLLTALQAEIAEVEYFQINVCEGDGDLLATIRAGK